jgi:flagellar hook-associated protein 1 FlgK
MSLTTSMEIAKSSLQTLQGRTAVVSRNIANIGNDFASRKIADTVSLAGGGVRLAGIRRAADEALFSKVLQANSRSGAQAEVVRGLDQLNATITDPEADASPAALVAALDDALQQYSAGPQDPVRAKVALDAAVTLADGLNAATDTVQNVREQADADIGRTVGSLNDTLADLEELNTEIVKGTRLGSDVTDQLDQRDQLISNIATDLGIRVTYRADNDVAIYTDSGVTLFDNTARTVTFDPQPVYDAATVGNPIIVDGVAVTGPDASMPISGGRLKGLTDLRDTIATTYQSQLDEVARGLIETFREVDQTGGGNPDATGIFSYAGSPAVPPSGTIVTGLAGEITVNPAVNPDLGGNLDLIRDGGIHGAAYDYNPGNAAGFSGRIFELSAGLSAERSFDTTAEAGTTDSVLDYAATSVGWLQERRRTAEADLEFSTTLQERSIEAFTQVTGANLDFEMTLLLEIERTYQASSRLVTTIDRMFQSLLEAV